MKSWPIHERKLALFIWRNPLKLHHAVALLIAIPLLTVALTGCKDGSGGAKFKDKGPNTTEPKQGGQKPASD
jgi:hypothetical protein